MERFIEFISSSSIARVFCSINNLNVVITCLLIITILLISYTMFSKN